MLSLRGCARWATHKVAGRSPCGRARGDVTEHGREVIATLSARNDHARAVTVDHANRFVRVLPGGSSFERPTVHVDIAEHGREASPPCATTAVHDTAIVTSFAGRSGQPRGCGDRGSTDDLARCRVSCSSGSVAFLAANRPTTTTRDLSADTARRLWRRAASRPRVRGSSPTAA